MSVSFSECNSVLITGASRGLGLQMVKHLVGISERPKKIIATARSPGTARVRFNTSSSSSSSSIISVVSFISATSRYIILTHELQQISRSHPEVYVVRLDVVNDASIEAAVQKVTSIVGPAGLNCLINNAAILFHTDLNSETRDSMINTFQTNTVSPLFITKIDGISRGVGDEEKASCTGFYSRWKLTSDLQQYHRELQQLEALMVFLSYTADMKLYSYRVSKAGLNMVMRCLAVDLQDDGILCAVVHPGWVQTDMGGEKAPLTPEESVSSLLAVISALSEKDHGQFLNYEGQNLPW
ncbi:C-signal-like [Clarias gariepinus]